MFHNIAYVIIIILISASVLFVLQKKYKFNMVLFVSLFIYHSSFTVYYYYYALSHSADANGYYKAALSGYPLGYPYFLENPVGTNFIKTLAYPLVQLFDMNFFSVMFLFSLFGFFGLLIFYVTVKENIGKSKLFTLVLFIPGLNFWTSALGKDSIAFFSIALITYGISNLEKRKSLIIVGILLLFLIRPHMALLIIFIMGLVVLLSSKSTSAMAKLFMITGSLAFLFLTSDFVVQYVGMNSLSTESVESYIEEREMYSEGGSGLELSSYNPVVKMFTYLLRPLFFDSSGLLSLVVSVENLFYLILFSLMIHKKFFRYLAKAPLFVKFNFYYAISALVILSATTPNLGIAIRQKSMFIVNLIIVVILYIHNRRRKKR